MNELNLKYKDYIFFEIINFIHNSLLLIWNFNIIKKI